MAYIVAIAAAIVNKMWRELCIREERGARENFPRSPGKVTLSNLEQIHLAPWMFSPLLRLMSWKAFLKQCYTRRGGGRSQIPVCVCEPLFSLFFQGNSRVLYPLYEQDFLLKKKKNQDVVVVSGLQKQMSSHVSSVSVNFAKVTIWTQCQERRCWYAPLVRRGTWYSQPKQNNTATKLLSFQTCYYQHGEISIYSFIAPHYFYWMT